MGLVKDNRLKTRKKKGVGIDFSRVKAKVGRRLPQRENTTKTDFKSQSIFIPEQKIAEEKTGAVSQRNLSLKDLLSQCRHRSGSTRKNALVGLKDLLGNYSKVLAEHTSEIIEKIAVCMLDVDKGVRDALFTLLRSAIFPALPQETMAPFLPILLAHVCGAMTHHVHGVREKGLSFLDLVVENYPSLLQSCSSSEIFYHIVEILCLGRKSRRSIAWHSQVLKSLLGYLRATSADADSGAAKGDAAATRDVYAWTPSVHGTSALHFYRSMPFLCGNPLSSTSSSCSVTVSPGFAEGMGSLHPRTKHRTTGKHRQPQQGLRGQLQGRGTDEVRLQESVPERLPRDRNFEHYEIVTAALVPILLDCWTNCRACESPSSIEERALQEDALECMETVLRLLNFLFTRLEVAAGVHLDAWNEGASHGRLSSPPSATSPFTMGALGTYAPSCVQEVCISLRDKYLTRFLDCIMSHFPRGFRRSATSGSYDHHLLKVHKRLAAVNTGVYSLFLHFLLPRETPGARNVLNEAEKRVKRMEKGEEEEDDDDDEWVQSLLTYFETACIDGMSESQKAPSSSCCSFEDMRTLISGSLSRGLPCLSPKSRARVLRAFNSVYLRSSPRSAVKALCVRMMLQALPYASEDMLGQWLDSLPRLLWQLKDEQVAASETILTLLHRIGRSCRAGSSLAAKLYSLQSSMVVFFCVSKGDCTQQQKVFGPFVSLAESCQTLAVDLLSFLGPMSRVLLQALAQCCLSPKLSGSMALRIVEVVSHGTARTEPSDCLSFLLTIITDTSDNESRTPPSTQQGDGEGTTSAFPACDGKEGENIARRRDAVVAAACAALGSMGEGNLLLNLISPTLAVALSKQDVPERTACAVVRAIAVCCRQCRLMGTISEPSLPPELTKMLPETIVRLGLATVQGRRELDTAAKGRQHCIFIPSVPVLLAFPQLLPLILDRLTSMVMSGLAANEDSPAVRQGMAAVDLLVMVLKVASLQKVLVQLESGVRPMLENFIAAALRILDLSRGNHRLEVLQAQAYRSRVQQLASTAACLFGVVERDVCLRVRVSEAQPVRVH